MEQAKIKRKIWDDIMFFFDGNPIKIEISKNCSTDCWQFKPYRLYNKGFASQISMLFGNIARSASAKENDGLFDKAKFTFDFNSAEIVIPLHNVVTRELWLSHEKPKDYAIDLDAIEVGSIFAHEIAILLNRIAKFDSKRVRGFYRSYDYSNNLTLQKIDYKKHLHIPFN